jgi:hypothetical protein
VHDISLLTSIRLEFNEAAPGTMPEGWSLARGAGASMAVIAGSDGKQNIVRTQSTTGPLIAIYAPWKLNTFDYGASIRLPGGNNPRAGLVFGYVDARNHYRVTLDTPAGVIRVSRLVDAVETNLAEKTAVIPAGPWLNIELEVQGGRLEVQYQDDAEQQPELEFTIDLPAEVPKAPVGVHLPAGSTAEFQWFEIEDEGELL